MANAVILILVIGYCLFLIYKQVQNRKAGKHLGCTGCGRFLRRLQRLQRVQDRRKQEKTLTGVKQQ